MTNNTIQQMLIDFNREFLQVVLPEDAVEVVGPQAGLLKLSREKDLHLIKLCPPRVNTDVFFEVFKEVARIIVKYKPDLEIDINKILNALPDDPALSELFVMRVFTPGTNLLESFQEDISPETFGFILSHVVRPFMKLYARKVSTFYDSEQWLKGTCPVCGGKPTLALLEKEEKKRYLYCGLCGITWRFQRLGCPYCFSNESQFFTVDGLDKYRVYYCDSCHGYIKTVNEAMVDSSNFDLFLEDINTVHLDLLALQEGYLNQPAEIAEK